MRSVPLPGATHDTQAVDLYDPAPRDGVARRPAILLVHGGGWYGGARDAYTSWAEHAAALGHPVGNVGYRTHEGSSYEQKRDDVVAGWRLLSAAFPEADGVCLVGSSAGAHLVTMLALEPDRPDELLPLRGVVSMNGPGSMRPENLLQSRERVTQLGLTPEEIDRLDAAVAAPPVQWLFLHAENETYFPHQHVAAMADRLEAAGHRTETVVVPGTDHGFGYRVLETQDERAELSARAVEGLWRRIGGN